MTIHSTPYKIDLSLMRDSPCCICTETVIEKVAKRVFASKLTTDTINQYKLCFYGHMCEGTETTTITAHLICEDCNPEVTTRALTQETFRKCIFCNIVLPGKWREKYTYDKNTHEFRREQEPLLCSIKKTWITTIREPLFITGALSTIGIMTIAAVCAATSQDFERIEPYKLTAIGAGLGAALSIGIEGPTAEITIDEPFKILVGAGFALAATQTLMITLVFARIVTTIKTAEAPILTGVGVLLGVFLIGTSSAITEIRRREMQD